MEQNDPAWTDALVVHDDLELATVPDGLEQVELDGGLAPAPDLFSDEDEAIAPAPRLRLPATLEVAEPTGHGPPASSAFNHRLEAKRSKGTETEKVTPRQSSRSTMLRLQNALSMRSSILARGRHSRTERTQRSMKASAPLESWTFPGRWCTSST